MMLAHHKRPVDSRGVHSAVELYCHTGQTDEQHTADAGTGSGGWSRRVDRVISLLVDLQRAKPEVDAVALEAGDGVERDVD